MRRSSSATVGATRIVVTLAALLGLVAIASPARAAKLRLDGFEDADGPAGWTSQVAMTPTGTPTSTPTGSATETPSATVSVTPTFTGTPPTPTVTATVTPTATITPTATVTPTLTPTNTPTKRATRRGEPDSCAIGSSDVNHWEWLALAPIGLILLLRRWRT